MGDGPAWPAESFEDFDRQGPIPLYFQVSSRLEQAIRSGAIPAGSRLEDEISISKRLGLSRPTIRRAIQELVDKGLVVRRRGVGTQVVQEPVSRPVELTSLFEDLEASHRTPGTQVLTHEVIDRGVARTLGLAVEMGDRILHLRRLRTSDAVPVAILENFLPADVVDLSPSDLEQRGLYPLLRAHGILVRVAHQAIGARREQADEHTLLAIEKGAPVLTAERTAFDGSARLIEFGRHCYRPDFYRFETTLVSK